MNSIIVYYRHAKDGSIDINNSKLFIGDDEHTIQHLTKGGYFSKSALLPFFDYEETNECGQPCLFITDEIAQNILQSNCNLKGKVWGEVNCDEPTDPNDYEPDIFAMMGVKGIDY